MENFPDLNFEPAEKPKSTSYKPHKKQAKKQPKLPNKITIGITVAVLGLAFFIISGFTSTPEKVGFLKKMFLPKPSELMQMQLTASSRTMDIPAIKIWEYYCAHDPEGYLHLLDKKYKAPQDSEYKGLHWKLQMLTGYGRDFSDIDNFTGMALIECWKKHPDQNDPFWESFKDDFSSFARRLNGGAYWRNVPIFWRGSDF